MVFVLVAARVADFSVMPTWFELLAPAELAMAADEMGIDVCVGISLSLQYRIVAVIILSYWW